MYSYFIRLLIGLTTLLAISGTLSAQEVCDWPPAPAAKAKLAAQPPPMPTSFPVVGGAGAKPELIFLGDSLTKGAGATNQSLAFPAITLGSLDGERRAYRVLALGGHKSTIITNLFLKERIPKKSVVIAWVGRNNFDDFDGVTRDISRISAFLGDRNYLFLAILRAGNKKEAAGTPRGEQLTHVNEWLKKIYPDNFIDVNEEIKCDDRADPVHLNDKGYAKVAAKVARVLMAKGW
ncbi:lysophospholipase L1-like esterase [Pararhizobium capsulatum DSM 1112]|uniref:Lysophospholipase L1-like esterase n=1 Tax=Pararhizobium capsulatum DSM 1112 TaxID=1121113 RepID=A0ABU0BVY4_9HYPH|nr:SGNH/GDSL hydrolase family protein [Pararhizobium capsulatum]MDQ0322422.1 lysophospholipase L1-like esterase [Pararhizobium capsulatum DSM 1112]